MATSRFLNTKLHSCAKRISQRARRGEWLGLADQLADALATYSRARGTGQAVRQVQDEAVPAMQSAFEKLRDFFHGCDYARALDAAPRDVLPVYLTAIDHVLGQAGLDEARLDILSDEFLERVAALEQKNLALETLRKLLNDQIRSTERSNLVRSRKFREALEDALLRYTNKAITTAEMIARLIDLARDLREAQQQGDALGLSTEEIAFYDALAENASAREVMQSDALRLMARELTEIVRRMPKLDWTQRESVRATLRRNIRRLLAKYGYPPDLAEGATQLVLRQAELSTEHSVE